MALYGLDVAGNAAAAGAPYATFHTGSVPVRITFISAFTSAATATSVGLYRPNNTPVASTSVLGVSYDGAAGVPAATASIDTAWTTSPTIGTNNALLAAVLPAAIGAGMMWALEPDGRIYVPASTYLVLWNFGSGAGAVPRISIRWIE